MTNKEAIVRLEQQKIEYLEEWVDYGGIAKAYDMAIEALEQRPCEDAISRQAAIDSLHSKFADGFDSDRWWNSKSVLYAINKVPPVNPTKTGHCKDCKYFEYDSVARVDGIPLIVAHELCKRWGDGCKTKEDGYCFLYEPQESEDKE